MIETSEKLKKRLLHRIGRAIANFAMIEEGDRIMVCISGGKDSFVLLNLLMDLQQRAPVSFDLLAVHLDQKQPGFPSHLIEEYLAGLGIEYRIVRRDIFPTVSAKIQEGRNPCGLCSRLRRGALYNVASEEKCSKIALGHHADDLLETFLLNLFHTGALKSMPPLLRSDDGRNTVIRPLAFCWEEDIEAFASLEGYPLVSAPPCLPEGKSRRRRMRLLIDRLEQEIPNLRDSMLGAMGNVVVSHLMDRRLAPERDEALEPAEG